MIRHPLWHAHRKLHGAQSLSTSPSTNGAHARVPTSSCSRRSVPDARPPNNADAARGAGSHPLSRPRKLPAHRAKACCWNSEAAWQIPLNNARHSTFRNRLPSRRKPEQSYRTMAACQMCFCRLRVLCMVGTKLLRSSSEDLNPL